MFVYYYYLVNFKIEISAHMISKKGIKDEFRLIIYQMNKHHWHF